MVCLGGTHGDLGTNYARVPQITHEEILRFIYSRFRGDRKAKASHPQWDKLGQKLYTLAEAQESEEVFVQEASDYIRGFE